MNLTEFILESLVKIGEFSMDLFDVATSGYQTSYKKAKSMTNPFYKELKERRRLTSAEYKKLEKQRFYNILNHLQKSGLVEKCKKKEGRRSVWIITRRGKDRLRELKDKKRTTLPRLNYKIEKDSKLKIVIFDIPEEQRRKRQWLRQNLIALEFSKLQKSVWMGYAKLPAEFLDELKNLNLLPFVHIFTADKTGTIDGY